MGEFNSHRVFNLCKEEVGDIIYPILLFFVIQLFQQGDLWIISLKVHWRVE